MAVQFDSDIKRGVTEWLAFPGELEVIPELNGRHELPDITELVASIVRDGQLQPVLIRKSGGKPTLIAGFSRWRAVQHINDKKLLPEPIRLRCSYSQKNDREAFLANIAENRVRNETTSLDDAHNIQRLINVFQMTVEDVADTYRASVGWVKDRLTLLEVAPEVEVAIKEGRIKPTAAVAIAKLGRAAQKAVVAKPGPVTAKDVKAAAPAPVKASKPAPAPTGKSLHSAIQVLLAECAQQPDVMIFEIHKDTIRGIREAL